MTVKRMDNVLIVVDDVEAAIAFFTELGLELVGRMSVEGEAVDRLVGLDGVRADLITLRTPDGHGRIELDKFHAPPAVRAGPEDAPVNALGIRRIMFAVDDIDDVTLARKVETEIFRAPDAPKGDVSVDVQAGVVYLRGTVADDAWIQRFSDDAKKVDGIKGVKNLLHRPGTPAPAAEPRSAAQERL